LLHYIGIYKMADESYRRYHSGRYPEYKGGEGQASYAQGSTTGYYKQDEEGQLLKKSTEANVDLTATEALRKITGFSDTGGSGAPKVTRDRLKKAGAE
jgi:hypothetical protein